MTAPRSLPRFRSALRRLLPGQKSAWLRKSITGAAENLSRRRQTATAADLLDAVRAQHTTKLTPYALDELGKALERDVASEPQATGGEA
jgi:hypothetical protein